MWLAGVEDIAGVNSMTLGNNMKPISYTGKITLNCSFLLKSV